MALDTGEIIGVTEMSGVTYLGEESGNHRFAAVQDSGNQLVTFDISLSANGTINSATAVSGLTLTPGFDFEGASFTNSSRNSVFISEESTPAIREYDLSTGSQLQQITVPAVYNSIRNNRGLESLTRSIGGLSMWTANEEALSIDGPTATDTNGTTVRLQQFSVVGNSLNAGPQFAYEVDPVHAGDNPDRSGLADLALLPDGTLLALERSLATQFVVPPFQTRIYQVDFNGATDISDAQFDSGLSGATFTPVAKTQLFSGPIDGGLGQNLEGLTLGPQLENGNWTLFGVVDSGDPLSGNTIASFEITPPPACSLSGDYNCNGTVGRTDYATWKDTLGGNVGSFADGNSNGIIDAADYSVWLNNLGASANASRQSARIPEPSSACLLLIAILGFSRPLLRPQ